MFRVQISPEVEFKMELELDGLDADASDHALQQRRAEVYAEFERRLRQAFPEGFMIYELEFGKDTGWHEELAE